MNIETKKQRLKRLQEYLKKLKKDNLNKVQKLESEIHNLRQEIQLDRQKD